MIYSTAVSFSLFFFFFNDTATTEIYTLSLHDALPILAAFERARGVEPQRQAFAVDVHALVELTANINLLVNSFEYFVGNGDRKSTRLNSSHANISYAVFCLKKKKIN